MQRDIIIKSSVSRLPEGRLKSNLGDLARCTPLLKCLSDEYLWLTDGRGAEILKWFIDPENIRRFGEDLEQDYDDTETRIFNLDNFVADSELLSRLKGGWRGFIPLSDSEVAPENEAIASLEPYRKRTLDLSYQQALIEGLGFVWREQDYAYPKVDSCIEADIGFNWRIHHEWPSKSWPEEYWFALEDLLSTYTVSYQRGLNNFEEYLRWLASCRIIVTPDTLGLHLSSALRKRVVAVTGPTDSREYSYGRIAWLKPPARDCLPCNLPVCPEEEGCLKEITPEMVACLIEDLVEMELSGAHDEATLSV